MFGVQTSAEWRSEPRLLIIPTALRRCFKNLAPGTPGISARYLSILVPDEERTRTLFSLKERACRLGGGLSCGGYGNPSEASKSFAASCWAMVLATHRSLGATRRRKIPLREGVSDENGGTLLQETGRYDRFRRHRIHGGQ